MRFLGAVGVVVLRRAMVVYPARESKVARPWQSFRRAYLRCVATSPDAHLGLSAIPHWPDRRPAPARPEAAAIVAAAVKPGTAEIVPLAVIAEILRGPVGLPCHGSLPAKNRNGIVGRLMIAGQEAIAVPKPLVSGRA